MYNWASLCSTVIMHTHRWKLIIMNIMSQEQYGIMNPDSAKRSEIGTFEINFDFRAAFGDDFAALILLPLCGKKTKTWKTTVPVPKDPLPVTALKRTASERIWLHVYPNTMYDNRRWRGGASRDILHRNWPFKWHDCMLFAVILNSLSHTWSDLQQQPTVANL